MLSLGGGAITSERVRAALARHTVVLLDVDAETAWQRCRSGRPLARDRDRFDAPARRARAAVRRARRRDPARRAPRRGAPRAAGDPRARALPARDEAAVGGRLPRVRGGGRARRRAAGRWPAGASSSPTRRSARSTPSGSGTVERDIRIPPGEARPRPWRPPATCCARSRTAGMAHDDHVVALGGGVVGDVAGFCAAVYQRGVPVVQVPTTLVAQVDSAYGGKTGVDLPEGKNYVGAYHQPAAVLADPSTLATLPAEELAAGWAEVRQDRPDRRRRPVAARAIPRARCARPRPRARLRAREAADRGPGRARRRPPPDPQPRPHGWACDRDRHRLPALPPRRGGRPRAPRRADALPAARAARRGRRAARRARACRSSSTRPIDREAVAAAVQRDKKRRGGRVGFVLVEAPGRTRTGCRVAEGDLRAAIEELAR